MLKCNGIFQREKKKQSTTEMIKTNQKHECKQNLNTRYYLDTNLDTDF